MAEIVRNLKGQYMKSIFKKQETADICDSQGCIVLPLLRKEEIQALKQTIDNYNVKDRNTYSSDILPQDAGEEYTRNLRFQIINAVCAALDRILSNYKIVSAGFVIKKPDVNSYIPPHQDCTYVDEQMGLHQTIVCWIPLVDTFVENGTIGAIIGSHRALDAPSPPYPNPRVPRFHDENVIHLFRLMTYFSLDAGEALFFNNRTLHGSLPNRSMVDRPAIRLGIVHRDAQICHYFLKSGSSNQRMFKYFVDELFYDKFSNERLLQIYDNGEKIPGYSALGELDYYRNNYSSVDLRKKLETLDYLVPDNGFDTDRIL